LLNRGTSEARRIARGLHPVQLDVGGLPAALQEFVDSVQTLFGVACDVSCPDPVTLRDAATAMHVYRIAQEAVNNAVRHSSAKRITVSLTQVRNTATLTVADDGKGLPKKAGKGKGIGLNIMAYRAQMIGGRFRVEPRPGGGTRVVCTFTVE
jgi:signal transduction histidine kinase